MTEQKSTTWHRATLDKVFEVIKSCTNSKQHETAKAMFKNYVESYPKGTEPTVSGLIDDIQEYCDLYGKLLKEDEKI